MSRRTIVVIAGLAGVVLLTGCGARASSPPESEPTVTVPALVDVSPDVPAAVRVEVPTIAARSAARRARELAVRIRNVSCLGVALGSGFAISRDILVTNRHVLAGAAAIQVSTWDGHSLEVASAEVGVLGDIGIAVVDGTLPEVGRWGRPARPGDPITVAGYPLGGKLTLAEGTVIDLVDGARFGVPGRIMRLSAKVEHGNSGSAVLDRRGRVVGVVYAIEVATGLGLAIPVDTIRSLERSGGFQGVPACGSD